jgi:predicted metal-dependent HD superfamily phosphohydrolase
MLKESFDRCWNDLGAKGNPDRITQQLLEAYNQNQRKYHTTQHLTECIAKFNDHQGLAKEPAEVEMALWFHDAIYDLQAADNEEKSAQWAVNELTNAAANREAIARIESLILATKHTALPMGQDQILLVDIDLSILGATSMRFAEYENQVRQEYSFVPEQT